MRIQAENLEEFKKRLGEKLELVDMMPGSQQAKHKYKKELFKAIINTSEYQSLRAEFSESKKKDKEKNKEILLQEAFELLQKIHPSLKKEELMQAIYGERKESMNIPELEEENHKIDKELTVEQKIKKGRKKNKVAVNIDGKKETITVLKKRVGKETNAFVREYIDDDSGNIPRHLIGEQIFNRNAVIALGLQKRLPTYKQMEDMRGGKNNHTGFLQKYFQRYGKDVFPGYRHYEDKRFGHVDVSANCRLSNGGHLDIYKRDMFQNGKNHGFGFSLRLCKI